MEEPQHRQVRTRRVFYIPGYVPVHPGRYRELYRKEGAAQAGISDYEIALSPKTADGGPCGWPVTGPIEGQETASDGEGRVWYGTCRLSTP